MTHFFQKVSEYRFHFMYSVRYIRTHNEIRPPPRPQLSLHNSHIVLTLLQTLKVV
jgi:hypothetical protein